LGIVLGLDRDFGFHNFRHSLATFLISKGKDVKTIQGLLRRAKASTTLDRYSQAMDEPKLAAQRDIALAIQSSHARWAGDKCCSVDYPSSMFFDDKGNLFLNPK
jgi:hypothetical protein